MKADRVKQLQTSEEVGASLATDFMSTGDPHFSDRYVERVQEVTPEQLRAVASKYLDRGRLLTTALLPAEFVGADGLPKAEDLLRPVAPTTQPGQANPESQIARVELDNGNVLLTKRITTSPLVVMNMYALGGLTAEDQKSNGLGNLSMQMLARGTKTRTPSRSPSSGTPSAATSTRPAGTTVGSGRPSASRRTSTRRSRCTPTPSTTRPSRRPSWRT